MSVTVDGTEYPIRTDYRAVIDVLCAMGDPALSDEAKTIVLLEIMFPEPEKIPQEHIAAAIKGVCDFIDCGEHDSGTPEPKLIDWQQDVFIIMPAINAIAHAEVRALPYLHWWTFWGYFLEIRESLLSTVISIRLKKAEHKRLDEPEKEFYRKHRDLIDFRNVMTEEEEQAIDDMKQWL